LRWGEPIAVNIADAQPDGMPRAGEKEPGLALTRAYQIIAERNGDGSAKLTVNVVSIDGVHEFYLDLAGALLGRSGELIAAGGVSTSLRVESHPVDQRYEIQLGRMRAGVEPAFIALGIARGDITGGPMGSFWGVYMRSETVFDIAALLSSPDERSRRTGLDGLARTNRAVGFEFLGDRLDERYVGAGPYSRHTVLRPLADVLAQIAREPGPADVRADAVRFLAYSEAPEAVDVLGALTADTDTQIHDFVAIGLTFLGQPDHLEQLRSIVNRAPAVPTVRRRWTVRLDEDPLIALARQHSDAAIDILGAALVDDLKGLQLVNASTAEARLEGRLNRASEICKLLGRTGNPRSFRWLTSADDLIETRPDLAQHFPRDELIESMLRFPDQTKDRVLDALETGKAAADFVYVLRGSRDPAFLPAVRTMLRRQDVSDYAMSFAVRYLWNLGSPPAIDAMREAYDRKVMSAEPRLWMGLCEALAANGDGRGMPDAFQVLLELKQPADPPHDEQKRRNWESDRDQRKREAEAVFDRASKDVLAEFLNRKTNVVSPAEREIVLRFLWRVPELPRPFAPVVQAWANTGDSHIGEMARRLLDRDRTSAATVP
jgi:hypothetical protein